MNWWTGTNTQTPCFPVVSLFKHTTIIFTIPTIPTSSKLVNPQNSLTMYLLPMLCFAVVSSYLDEYNLVSKAPMHLVMFKFAIEHVSRVARVLKQDNGHVLLVGMFIALDSCIKQAHSQTCTKVISFYSLYFYWHHDHF